MVLSTRKILIILFLLFKTLRFIGRCAIVQKENDTLSNQDAVTKTDINHYLFLFIRLLSALRACEVSFALLS